MSTLIAALNAAGAGDPRALRKCVEAIGDALAYLVEEAGVASPETDAAREAKS